MANKQTQFALDVAVLISAFVFAYLLRFDFTIPRSDWHRIAVQLPYVVLIQLIALSLSGVYAFVWRYVGMAEAKAFIAAALWSGLPLLILRIALPERLVSWRVPFSIIFMDALLAFGGILFMRVMRRAFYERSEHERRRATAGNHHTKRSVLLIGAGRAGVLAAREIQGRGDINLEIKGFVDDEPKKQRSVIHNVRVVGTTNDLPRLVSSLNIDHVVITIAQASRAEIRRIVEICEKIPVKVRIIPGLFEILQGNVEVSRIRDIQIEDLLGREPVRLDEDSTRQFLTGKVVMVTGAGGSIGAELARQVAIFQPSRLLLVERAEFVLFDIDRELRRNHSDLCIIPLVADVGDEERMRQIFTQYGPAVVVHAAAHKHVPMMECNVGEAVKNNVLATKLLGELAGEFGVEVFVLISTDKAVRPTSVMGATKRVAELVVQHLGQRYPTRFVAVRFGNVMGSAGSVVQIFREQIKKGLPLTVTHPDMVRYFLTIPEAVQLVLQASAMADGGEIYILDMGEPVKIFDLARDAITLSGLKPFEDIDIIFTGIRPGEKLFEELKTTEEEVAKTRHPKIFICRIATLPAEKIGAALDELGHLTRNAEEQSLRIFLNEFLPESQLTVAHPEPELEAEQVSIGMGA